MPSNSACPRPVVIHVVVIQAKPNARKKHGCEKHVLLALPRPPHPESKTHTKRNTPANTGACPYNRPCAHQYVGEYQSCMVETGRFIPRASHDRIAAEAYVRLSAWMLERSTLGRSLFGPRLERAQTPAPGCLPCPPAARALRQRLRFHLQNECAHDAWLGI
eukprot:COSAG05_NODE_639_length_8156_cov_122.162840_9_plen_162_part_00